MAPSSPSISFSCLLILAIQSLTPRYGHHGPPPSSDAFSLHPQQQQHPSSSSLSSSSSLMRYRLNGESNLYPSFPTSSSLMLSSQLHTTSSSWTTSRRKSISNTNSISRRRRPCFQLSSTMTLYNDFDDFFQEGDHTAGGAGSSIGSSDSINNKNNNNMNGFAYTSDSDMYASLRARQEALIRTERQREKRSSPWDQHSNDDNDDDDDERRQQQMQCWDNWKQASCVSTVRLTLNDDWVRRIAVDLYPLAIVGGAGGGLYLTDLEGGDILDCLDRVHLPHHHASSSASNDNDDEDDEDDEDDGGSLWGSSSSSSSSCPPRPLPTHLDEALDALYGPHDGGGVIAIAVKGDLIVSSGREGGVHVCTIEGTEDDGLASSSSSSSRRGTRRPGQGGGSSSSSSLPSSSSSRRRTTRLRLQPQGKLRGLEEPLVDGADEYDRDNLLSDGNRAAARHRRDIRRHDRRRRRVGSASLPTAAPLITGLAFDEQGTLWVAGYDGVLRGYDHEQTDLDDKPLMLRQRRPDHEINVWSPILGVSVHDEIGCGVVTTLTDGVFVFSLDDGHILDQWNPFQASMKDEYARTALIVQTDERSSSIPADGNHHGRDNDDDDDNAFASSASSACWSVVVGGSKGSMYQRRLAIHPQTGLVCDYDDSDYDDDGNGSVGIFLDQHRPYDGSDEDDVLGPIKVRPNHMGPVVALASPGPGLLVSGSHDGTMRVWDCSLYGSSGKTSSRTTDRTRMDGDDDEEDDDDDDDDDDNDDEEDNPSFFLEDHDGTVDGNVDDVKTPKRPKVLYALSGYKVWLGSIVATSKKLLSDGADNSIIVHSFDEDEEDVLRSREEDEDDDFEDDLSFD